MRVASIDIGSNTVLLLIADTNDGELVPLRNEYSMPRLGKGLTPGGNILDDRIDELEKILISYKSIIDEMNCEVVIAKATSAMRRAANAEEIIKRTENTAKINIEVIPGEEEARLSFLGAISAVKSMNRKMVIDIGGGSTEIIIGDEDNISFSKSFQIGTVSLTESFFKNDPPLETEIEKMNNFIIETFKEIKEVVPPDAKVIAVAGTPTSLSCMNQGLRGYDESKVENSVLELYDFKKLTAVLKVLMSKEILEKYGSVVKGRNDVIYSGSLLLYNLLKMNNLNKLTVSGRGIRYGAVVDFINKRLKEKSYK